MAPPIQLQISSTDIVKILDRLGTCLGWLGSKQMYVWKLKYTIERVEKARDELRCRMTMVEDTMRDAEHNGWRRNPEADGWVKQGYVYVGYANSVVEEYKKRLGVGGGEEPATSVILSVFLCPCETVSGRYLNGEAIMRMNHILAHKEAGSQYATGAFEDVSFVSRAMAAAAPVSLGSPDSPNTVHTNTMRLSGFTEYRALARSESLESVAVVVRVKAPAYMLRSRAPIDLVLVLDASASMRVDGKLDRVKQGSMFVIHNLDAKDRLSIVTFGKKQRVLLLLPPTSMSDDGKRLANRKVQSLKAIGNGTVGPAMDLAYETLDKRLDKDRLSNILLLTDGQDKRIFEESQRYAGIRYSLTRRSRYPTYTFGFDLDHDPRTLYYLAFGGCGTYSFVTDDDKKSILHAMALCIGGLTSIVAQKVKISIGSAHQDVKISRIMSGGYDHHVEAAEKSGFISIKDLYASEEKSFIVYVNVPAADKEAGATKLLTVTASYYCPLTMSDVCTEKLEVSVERPRRVWGHDDRNISVEVATEVTRARVFDGVKDIWLKSSQCTQYNLADFHFAGIDVMDRQLAHLMETIDATKEAEAAGERWDALRSNLGAMREAISLLDILYRDSRVTGLPYLLSWLSSHQWQRAATSGSVCKSRWFSFWTTRMHNMIESVGTAPSAYISQ